MKNVYLTGCLSLLLCSSSFSQEVGSVLIDSSFHYAVSPTAVIDPNEDDYSRNTDKDLYTYDAQNRLVEKRHYSYDISVAKHFYTDRTEYAYDLKGNKILDFSYRHLNRILVPYERYDYVYGPDGQETMSKFEHFQVTSNDPYIATRRWYKRLDLDADTAYEEVLVWHNGLEKWVYDFAMKKKFTTDPSTIILEEERSFLNLNSSRWELSQKYVYGYDAKNNRIVSIQYSWDATGKQWKESSKTKYVYSVKDQEIEQEISRWDNNSNNWYPYSKFVKDYDNKGNLSLNSEYYYNQKWIEIERHEYCKDFHGNETCNIYFHYNSTLGQLELSGSSVKASHLYDDKHRLIERRDTIWSEKGKAWVPYQIYTYHYNDLVGKRFDWIQLWNQTDNRWYNNTVDIHYYSAPIRLSTFQNDVDTSSSSIHFFPNPAKDVLYVSNAELKSEYSIYTLEGKLLLSGRLEKNTIELGSLSKGTYAIKIESSTPKLLVKE